MRVQITHLKAPWPLGAVVGDVLDLPAVPVWAVGKCKQVDEDVELTIITGDGSGEALLPVDSGEGAGEALPPIDTGEGEGAGQPLPVIDDEPVKAKGKHK